MLRRQARAENGEARSAFEEPHPHGNEDFVGYAVVLTWKAAVLRIKDFSHVVLLSHAFKILP